MARRGSFGRSPRPVASLTNTIVAIAREMQQQEDQNIVDAWKSAGTYHGHKVTDEELLAYWKKRASQVDQNDPLYDTYQSAYLEYDYSIHESKIRLAYDQGKASASAVAAFYSNWSKKVPKNSEFWRILQRDAAEFLRSERANSRARAAQQKELSYQNNLKSIDNSKVAPGAYLLDVFKKLAQRGLRPGGGNPLIDPMNGELYQFDAGDVQDMLGMITRLTDTRDVVTNTGKGGRAISEGFSATGNVLYHDDMGNPVTGADVLKKLQAMGFKGNLTLDSMYTLIGQQKDGLKAQADLATKTGHYSDAKRYNDQLMVVSEIGRQVKAWPVEQTYLDARNHWVSVVNDPHSSQQDIIDATDKYRKQLTKFAQDPAIAADDVFRNKLIAESQGTEGATTAAEDFTGLNQDIPGKDIAKANRLYDRAVASIDAVANGAMWAAGEWDDKTGAFTPGPSGTQIGPATIDQIRNHSGGVDPQVAMAMDNNGRFIPVAVIGTPITVHSFAPDGTEIPVKAGTNPVVGYAFTLNGKTTIQYKDGKGNTLYSDLSNAPWGADAHLTGDPGGYSLTIPMPQQDLSNSGFSTTQSARGQTILQYDPYQAMLATDQEHRNVILNGGGDPNTDFRSYALAHYQDDPQGAKAIAGLKNDPIFQQIVQREMYQSTGFKPQVGSDGSVQWVGGDQHQFDRGSMQSDHFVKGLDPAGSAWDRTAPASSLLPDNRFENTGPIFDPITGRMEHPIAVKPLGTGKIGATPFMGFANAFQPGTLNLNFNDHGTSGINEIKMSGAITVPTPPQLFTPPRFQSRESGPISSLVGPSGTVNPGTVTPALQTGYASKQGLL